MVDKRKYGLTLVEIAQKYADGNGAAPGYRNPSDMNCPRGAAVLSDSGVTRGVVGVCVRRVRKFSFNVCGSTHVNTSGDHAQATSHVPPGHGTKRCCGPLGARIFVIILKTSRSWSRPTAALTGTLVVLPRHLWYIAQHVSSLNAV